MDTTNDVMTIDQMRSTLRRDERGAHAADYVDDLYGAFAGVMGG